MENKIFRKSALDRISSPEQLNETMKVAGPGVWCMLAGLAVTFAAFIVWGFLGSIPETAELSGTALAAGENPLAVYCYLPIDETKALTVGMSVRVSPDYAPREQYGYIIGKVQSIGRTPVTADKLQAEFGSDAGLLAIPSGNVIEVVIELETTDDGSIRWSKSKGASLDVTTGSTCELTVILSERRPIDLMFS
ncbi:MAG: hypothetical protein FWG31_10490 [Oscillospiraceae bacterium]|nr:hypothetical protein [Oscillospiraceae bacterium]